MSGERPTVTVWMQLVDAMLSQCQSSAHSQYRFHRMYLFLTCPWASNCLAYNVPTALVADRIAFVSDKVLCVILDGHCVCSSRYSCPLHRSDQVKYA